MSTIPSELANLKFPHDWGDWNILSGRNLALPSEWKRGFAKYAKSRDDAEFYPLEVKQEAGRKKVIVEGQVPFPVPGAELGRLDGVLMPLPLRLILYFNDAGALIDFERGEPSHRDLASARRHILTLLGEGKISPPGDDSPSDKPWRIVLDDSGKFKLERVYLA